MAPGHWEGEEGSPLPHRTNPDPSSILSKPGDYKYGSSDEEDDEGEGGTEEQLQVTNLIAFLLHLFTSDSTLFLSLCRWNQCFIEQRNEYQLCFTSCMCFVFIYILIVYNSQSRNVCKQSFYLEHYLFATASNGLCLSLPRAGRN